MSGRTRGTRRRSRPTPNQSRALRTLAQLRARRFPSAGPFRVMAANVHVPAAGGVPYRARSSAHGDSVGGVTSVLSTPVFGRERRGRVMRAETKMHRTWSGTDDDGPAYVTLTTAGTVVGLSGIEQGSDINQREGLSVRAHRLNLRISAGASGSGPESSIVRILVLRCKNAASAVDFPTAATVFEYPGSDTFPHRSVNSPISHAAHGRYTVLDDFRLVLNGQNEAGSTSVFDRSVNVGRNINWADDMTKWDTASGALYFLVVSNVAHSGPVIDRPRLEFNSELTYTDS